jgi:hypothetical protein
MRKLQKLIRLLLACSIFSLGSKFLRNVYDLSQITHIRRRWTDPTKCFNVGGKQAGLFESRQAHRLSWPGLFMVLSFPKHIPRYCF